MTTSYIIASQRPWNAELANRLMERTSQNFTLVSEHSELTEEKLKKSQPKYIFFPHWSNRIPATVWQNYESIIFHMTDVPYGRGGSPLQNLIMRGHESTMITALRCVEELDAGPVYLKRSLSLSGSAEEIFIRADKVIEEMIMEILEKQPIPQPQVGEPTFFTRKKPADGNIAHAQSTRELFNMIRMLDAEGYPHAFLELGNFKMEFKQATQQDDFIEATVIIRDMRQGEAV